ncbi:MAG TPA: hypothetical protein VH373_08370 [Jatrophihabitantaceae bacterium]
MSRYTTSSSFPLGAVLSHGQLAEFCPLSGPCGGSADGADIDGLTGPGCERAATALLSLAI